MSEQNNEQRSQAAGTDTVDRGNSNAKLEQLEAYREDATGEALSTNTGTRIADNQNTLKAGERGPSLLEDFIMREKITHFDHERIPERVVHARGSAAHGYFEAYEDLSDLTKAGFLAEAGKRTPVFVRFSTVQGPRGSADTVRDVRGFAVKFYTDEGNFDLVGNNMPVFFIQDAIKFPDFVHAVKPEPHNEIPTGASAHDTFWDFVSLTPESAHMVMWLMSDRAIPIAYRNMQGFGVHTFRLVNAAGESVLVKFHWRPKSGTCSLVWDEAQKLAGKDPDFNRRTLWEDIEKGDYPEWEPGPAGDPGEPAGQLRLRPARPHQAGARGVGAGKGGGADGTQPQPRQFLRRDRTGGVPRRPRGPRNRLHQRPAVAGSAVLLYRHPTAAPERAELQRNPDQPPAVSVPQQPARRAAPADHQPRPGFL